MQNLTKENYCLLSPNNQNFSDFFTEVSVALAGDLQAQNIVIDLLNYPQLTLDQLLQFSDLSEAHLARQKSFILINASLPIEAIPEELAVVPTLQEAEDYIQMDELQREFGLDDEF